MKLMKLNFIILGMILLISLIGIVYAQSFGINNPNLPTLNPPTLAIVNKSNVNSSNFWDALNTPADILHNALGSLQGGVAGQFYHLTLIVYNWITGNYNNFWLKNETITGNISGNLSGSYGYSLQDAYDSGSIINVSQTDVNWKLENSKSFNLIWKPVGTIDFIPGFSMNITDKSIGLTAKKIILSPYSTTASNVLDVIINNPGNPYTSQFRIIRDGIDVFYLESGTGTLSDIRSVGWTPLDDAKYDLGTSDIRWNNSYFAGKVYQGVEGAETLKIESTGLINTTGNIIAKNITIDNSKLCLVANCSKYIWYNGSNVVIKG